MTKTSNHILTERILTSLFKHFRKYVSNPPEPLVIKNLITLITNKDFKSVIKVYGARYVLILLCYFEFIEDYKTCRLILSEIDSYNIKSERSIPTHLRDIKITY